MARAAIHCFSLSYSLIALVEISDGLVSFVILRVLGENLLISLDCLLGFGKIFRRLYAGAILRVNRASNKHRGSLVIRIQCRSFPRVLFRFREFAFAISARGLVQLVLGPDPINNSAPGAGGNKDSPKKQVAILV